MPVRPACLRFIGEKSRLVIGFARMGEMVPLNVQVPPHHVIPHHVAEEPKRPFLIGAGMEKTEMRMAMKRAYSRRAACGAK